MDQTVVSTAMPPIVSELNGFDRYAWVTVAYLLTSTIGIPIFGKLSDIYGRKWLLLTGIGLFGISSILCASAGFYGTTIVDGMNQLLVARGIQGIGAGIILTLCFIVIADIIPAAERGRYQGHFAAVFALASVVGPVLGGWIAEKYTWRWIFLINVPFAILSFAVLFHSLKLSATNHQRKAVDVFGIIVFISSVIPLLASFSLVGNLGFTSPIVLAGLVLSVLLAALFIAIEKTVKEPFLPLSVFKISAVSISSISVFVTGIGMFGSILLIPLYLQSVTGISAANSGLFLTPLILVVAGGSIVGGQWMSSSGGYKRVLLTALSLMTVGVICLATITVHSSVWFVLCYMVIVGIGLGLLLPIYTIVIQNAVPESVVGAVTGFSQFFRSMGGTIGTAMFGSLLFFCYRHHLEVELRSSLPNKVAAIIADPLIKPIKIKIALAQMFQGNSSVSQMFDLAITNMRESMVFAITSVFALYAALLVVTFILNLFIKEIPLRKTLINESGTSSST
jgi:EmrB/QacA subfamily drug resistance transporter